MQLKMEHMHAEWGEQEFLKRPARLNHLALARLEDVLLVERPSGVPATGWVPVAIDETYPEGAGGSDAGYAPSGTHGF